MLLSPSHWYFNYTTHSWHCSVCLVWSRRRKKQLEPCATTLNSETVLIWNFWLKNLSQSLVPKDTKTWQNLKTWKQHQAGKNPKTTRGMPIIAMHSWTKILQSTRKQGFRRWTDRQVMNSATYRLNWARGQVCEN